MGRLVGWLKSYSAKIHPMTITKQAVTSVGEALADARRRLAPHSDTPSQDAQVLLSHITGRDKAQFLAHPDHTLSAIQLDAWEQALGRLEAGEALPYVLGEWQFFGLTFQVTPAVLIPRPETELLVEAALDWLRAHPERRWVVDIGTGSGAIAVALAKNIADLRVAAVEISAEALKVAASNVQRHGLEEQVRVVQGNLFASIDGLFDLICANLPYIPSDRLGELDVAKREPRLALAGGPDGLVLIRSLLQQAPGRLAPGGLLLAEVDDSHEDSAAALAGRYFPEADIAVLPDLAGKPRLLRVRT